MRYVILRDDDTNAFTPTACLERLYRPFLDRGFPVNLATIPEVNVNTRTPDGAPEGFLFYRNGCAADKAAIGSNTNLINYLHEKNPGYEIVQHGCHHDWLEFDCPDRSEAARRIDRGTRLLMDADFSKPETFVAPYDKLSRASYVEAVKRFRVLSTGWFELRRLPYSWWPRFAVKKWRRRDHWQSGDTFLLSHPGCLLSCHKPVGEMLDNIRDCLANRPLTVLVTHWWEYFRGGDSNEPFIESLHETADYLGRQKDLKVISFADLASNRLNFRV